LKDLQDALGGLNDLAAREALVAGSVSETVVAHLEAAKDDADKLLGDAEDAYAKIMATKAFWKG
jgi:hypothetical protein